MVKAFNQLLHLRCEVLYLSPLISLVQTGIRGAVSPYLRSQFSETCTRMQMLITQFIKHRQANPIHTIYMQIQNQAEFKRWWASISEMIYIPGKQTRIWIYYMTVNELSAVFCYVTVKKSKNESVSMSVNQVSVNSKTQASLNSGKFWLAAHPFSSLVTEHLPGPPMAVELGFFCSCLRRLHMPPLLPNFRVTFREVCPKFLDVQCLIIIGP